MSLQEQTSEAAGGVPHGAVASVNSSEAYTFSKPQRDEIVLVAGIGVDGDTHAGVNVRHRSRVRADPSQPNLRQVHFIQRELFDEVADHGFEVAPGQLGENVTTDGLDLLALPRGTVLRFGTAGAAERPAGAGPAPAEVVADVVAAARGATLDQATAGAVDALVAAVDRETGDDPRPAVVLTGLRNPCAQIDRFSDGLLGRVAYRDADGVFVRKAGIMGVVLRGGPVRRGDPITAELPPEPHLPLERV
ncbi:MOSC domain-containing protein [Jidongwangia harbinensis]|uniref:MOSC domain-containing protein n=1 Tax=Jidongwangia harbinensis TaxID=2878561 RepID=UPI001CD92CB0|nr:MOSC domain-containing protein [Jidongwangia harbinensis]MCA2217865.1 transcription elongation factor [Jidongwangia harbinensis]